MFENMLGARRSPARRSAKTFGVSIRRHTYHRRLLCEPLEDRRLLSVGAAGSSIATNLAGGVYLPGEVSVAVAAEIVPTNQLVNGGGGAASQPAGTNGQQAAPLVGPTISSIVVLASQGTISWNVLAAGSLLSNLLTIDGAAVAKINGPFAAASGVNFSATFGSLPVGSHSFVITATDNAGHTSQSTGTFQVLSAGPTISSVAVVAAQGLMTWNVQSAGGVTRTTLAVDGVGIAKISGPFAASSGVNFSGFFGGLTAGTHTFVITATDNAGITSQSTGSFQVSTAGPTISSVVVVTSPGVITWNVLAAAGVARTTLAVDGIGIAKISGPFAASSGVNFSGVFGSVSAGTHNFLITATDNAGRSAQFSNTFVA